MCQGQTENPADAYCLPRRRKGSPQPKSVTDRNSSKSSGFPPRNLKTTFSRLTHTLTIPSCDITRSFSLHYSKNVHDTLLDSFWLSYLLADLERSPSTRQLNTHRNDSVDPSKDSPFWIADSGYANWKESNLELRFVPPLAISPLDWH
jgi:hypothetical protein